MILHQTSPTTSLNSLTDALRFCEFCARETPVKSSQGQILCTLCGCVLQKDVQWVHNYSSQVNTTLKNQLYNMDPNISSFKDHGGKSVNYTVANSLKRTIQRTKISTTYDRTKLKGLLQIDRLVKLLDLPVHIESQIVDKFLQFNQRGLLRNKNTYSCVSGLIVIICNQNNIPISMSQILKHTVVSKKKFNSDYFYLFHLFETAGPISAKIQAHVNRYLSYIQPWSSKEEFLKELDLVISKIRLYDKIGREGIVTAATIIYILLKYYKYPNSQQILKILLINRLTIKNCWKNILIEHPEMKQYEPTKTLED